MMMFCTKCGYKNEERAVFCARCGSPVKSPSKSPRDPRSKHRNYKLFAILGAVCALTVLAGIARFGLDGIADEDTPIQSEKSSSEGASSETVESASLSAPALMEKAEASEEASFPEAPESDFKYEYYEGFGMMITAYLGSEQHLRIPDTIDGEPVVELGMMSFSGKDQLTSVVIPDSVVLIDQGAFGGCSRLESVELPDGLKHIDEYVFYSCSSLKHVDIPDQVSVVYSTAFFGCPLDDATLERIRAINWPQIYSAFIGQFADTYGFMYRLRLLDLDLDRTPELLLGHFVGDGLVYEVFDVARAEDAVQKEEIPYMDNMFFGMDDMNASFRFFRNNQNNSVMLSHTRSYTYFGGLCAVVYVNAATYKEIGSVSCSPFWGDGHIHRVY